jgi:hypothetical protein
MNTYLLDAMTELNQRMSLSTAFPTWNAEFHIALLETSREYRGLFTDTRYLINQWNGGAIPGDAQQQKDVEDIAIRIFYVLSTSPQPTLSLATLASKLEADCIPLGADYEDNIQHYSDMIYFLRNAKIFRYDMTATGHPVLTPLLQVQGELRTALDAKFASALPQVGGVMGDLDSRSTGLIPGVRFSGKSSKRKTPLNEYDRKTITLVSKQGYRVDMDIIKQMPYYVPAITDTGVPITEREQEDARTAYYRFTDMAEEAEANLEILQLPTTQDSRGRFYNAATDPAIRLSLRSKHIEGHLTPFELKLLRGE